MRILRDTTLRGEADVQVRKIDWVLKVQAFVFNAPALRGC